MLIAGWAATLWPLAAQVQELIANQDLVQRQLNQNEARLYFSMRLQRWSDETPVKVFVLPDDHPLHVAFAKTVLGLFPYQLRAVWDRQLFSGTGQAPTTVANEEEMIKRVATTPGGIGYAQGNPKNPRIQVMGVH